MSLSKNMAIAAAGLFSATLFATQARAECNINLPYEKLIDCIVVEGSGEKYNAQEEKDFSTNDTESQKSNEKSNALASNNNLK